MSEENMWRLVISSGTAVLGYIGGAIRGQVEVKALKEKVDELQKAVQEMSKTLSKRVRTRGKKKSTQKALSQTSN